LKKPVPGKKKKNQLTPRREGDNIIYFPSYRGDGRPDVEGMSILEELKYLFEPRVRRKGKRCFYTGAVREVSFSHDEVRGVVKEKKRYTPGVKFYPQGMPDFRCTCPYFLEWGENCKHLWALLLYVDAVMENGGDPVGVFKKKKREGTFRGWSEVKERLRNEEPPGGETGEGKKGFYLLYGVNRGVSRRRNAFVFTLRERYRRENGTWGRIRNGTGIPAGDVVLTEEDRKILCLLYGDRCMKGPLINETEFCVSDILYEYLLPLMAATGRLVVEGGGDAGELLRIAEGGFGLALAKEPGRFVLRGIWRVEGRCVEEDEIDVCRVTRSGTWLLWKNRVARIPPGRGEAWQRCVWRAGVTFSPKEVDDFIGYYNARQAEMPPLELPPELACEPVEIEDMKPLLYVHFSHGRFWGEPAFVYNGLWEFSFHSRSASFLDLRRRKRIVRDARAEEARCGELEEAGFSRAGRWFYCMPERVEGILGELASRGWTLFGEKRRRERLVVPGPRSLRISTGVDWFDVAGDVWFDEERVPLGRAMEALKKGTHFVRLGEGRVGLLPYEWLRKYRDVFREATRKRDGYRIPRSRAAVLLDAAREENVDADRRFREIMRALENFGGVVRREPPAGFRGELREYQKEGLGWLEFLDTFRFGGCLGDDMGLGKTVQVLAFLQKKKEEAGKLYAIVVAPASVIFNWVSEVNRFTPNLRVLAWWGPERKRAWEERGKCDILLTSYATLVRDITLLEEERFDYAVFDEAHQLKNPWAKRVRAARRLKADVKVGLTGTPVENHLGDLWSQFSVLNPGLLGSLKEFKERYGDGGNRERLKRLIYPFILRRTKAQVLRDLPPRVDEILYCEMTEKQRAYYTEVRDILRSRIMGRIAEAGLGEARMHILEGLLRLRQICCSPILVDARRGSGSGKLETLKSMVRELVSEESKALIFSQFTAMLGVIREWVEEEGIRYEYLDGATRDRKERIESFQNDPGVKLFLVSLKAGGVGINLTAADYVFIYDPWWNPAVEEQAVDRTHRIGRTRTVFTYRMVTRNSIEEKVHALQKEKKALIREVIESPRKPLSALTRGDIEFLFSCDEGGMEQFEAVVRDVTRMEGGYAAVRFGTPWRSAPCPGTFVGVRCGDGTLLRRPFSIAGWKAGEAEIVFRVVGPGTARLAGVRPGGMVTVLGPLGRGFPAVEKEVEICYVGGGSGLPPLLYHASLHGKGGKRLLAGFRTAGDVFLLDRFEACGVEVEVTTEDGSRGRRGRVTDILEKTLASFPAGGIIFSSGPISMLKQVARLCRAACVEGYVCLERYMACGMGACYSCVQRVRTAEGNLRYARVCTEGPVFSCERLVWNEE